MLSRERRLGTRIENGGRSEFKKGERVFLSIRPEYIKVNPREKIQNEVRGRIEQRQYLGSYGRFYVSVQGVSVLVERHDITENDVGILPEEGDDVILGFDSRDCLLFR